MNRWMQRVQPAQQSFAPFFCIGPAFLASVVMLLWPSAFGPDSPFSWATSPQLIVGCIALTALYLALILRARWVRHARAAAPRLSPSLSLPVGGSASPRLPGGSHTGRDPVSSESARQVELSSLLWAVFVTLGACIPAVEIDMGNKAFPPSQTDYGFNGAYFPS